ncbi:hypothetical protein CN311_03050 [Mesorhizobium sanjuanii]|uniref:JmjC domain-containing protein n=1 Tax=Mesorhizobium sanjuanii TaxID=2037900 RepID=A0A2A6FLG2_9HYPH|nr:hypothetical protein CN311_03050 [Mesorhizobium sanjuanii]
MEQPPEGYGASSNATADPYFHDIPLLGLVENLAEDCQPFPANFLDPSYRSHWWRYSQFFMGPAGTVTPLHFDTLLSHNLFFQIYGDKQFTILPPSQAKCCGPAVARGLMWIPSNRTMCAFPQYEQATPVVVTVCAGDILYMPPGTLHLFAAYRPRFRSISIFHMDLYCTRWRMRTLECRQKSPTTTRSRHWQ